MADLKCGLAVRIISGIFPFLDPGRGRHQMEDSSGDNQAEGADTASTRSRNQALCHYIDTHSQTNIIGPVSTALAQNVCILGKYVIEYRLKLFSLRHNCDCESLFPDTASVRIVTTRDEGKLMCGVWNETRGGKCLVCCLIGRV